MSEKENIVETIIEIRDLLTNVPMDSKQLSRAYKEVNFSDNITFADPNDTKAIKKETKRKNLVKRKYL